MIDSIVLPNISSKQKGLMLDIYRGDKESVIAPGNKFHKLAYHLKAAQKLNVRYIATFGGPYSNHIHAFVHTVIEAGLFPLIVVRGELHSTLTPTLQDCVDIGAELFPSARDDYQLGLESQIKNQIDQKYSDVYWVPEGGGGVLGALGCRDWADQVFSIVGDNYDTWCVASGTTTTAVGLASSDSVRSLQVFNALKGSEDIELFAGQLWRELGNRDDFYTKLTFHHSRDVGRFGRLPLDVSLFLRELYTLNPEIQLDPVYTGKLVYRIWLQLREGRWPFKRSLIIHTGGLQGWRGVSDELNPYV